MIYLVKYIKEPKIKFISFASLAMLIHYTFLFPVIILLIIHVMPKKKIYLSAFVLASLFVFALSSTSGILGTIEQNIEVFDETNISSRASGYSDVEMLSEREERAAKTNWYVRLRSDAILYFLLIIVFLEVFGIWKFTENKFLKAQFPFVVIFFCITLITVNLGS